MPGKTRISGLASLGGALLRSPAASRLKDEAREYVQARSTRMLDSLEDKLGSVPDKIADRASGGGPMTAGLFAGAKKLAQGQSPLKAGVSSVTTGVKEMVKGVFGKGGSGGDRPKMTNIVEDIDIGLPLSTTYNQWTQVERFSSFMKGVESVERKSETESTWRLRVAFSRRTWTAKVVEQIPDERIVWTSDGPKGSTKGVVTFHPLADNLTRVLVVLEYYPSGLFEKTANLWRAPGRRARLDLKHFRRYLMMKGEEDGSWRGEIRDGEVVAEPEDEEMEESPEQDEDELEQEEPEDEYEEDQYEDEEEEGDEEEAPEGEYDEADGEYEDEEVAGDPEGDYETEDEDELAGARSR